MFTISRAVRIVWRWNGMARKSFTRRRRDRTDATDTATISSSRQD
jgi:hypothetical protein